MADGLAAHVTDIETCSPLDARREWAESLLCTLRRLPAAQQIVVSLAYFKERSHADIARELDLTPAVVAHIMASALAAIAQAQSSPA